MSTENTAHDRAGTSVPPRDSLYRAVLPGVEVRSQEDGSRTLTGHFAVFDDWTEINSVFEGQFLERIAPGAFKKTFRENRNGMKVLFDHGQDPSIGNKPLGAIRSLEEDERGARYEVDLLDTSYVNDLLPGLERGLFGASFRFRVMREDVDDTPERSEWNPRGLPERTIREAKVMEFGPVTFPAYANATAGVRSISDDVIMRGFLQQPDKLRALLNTFLTDEPQNLTLVGEQGPERFVPAAKNSPDDSSPDSFRSETEETAPEAEAPTASAEPEAHPAPVRRTSVLFGLHTEEKPKWEL